MIPNSQISLFILLSIGSLSIFAGLIEVYSPKLFFTNGLIEFGFCFIIVGIIICLKRLIEGKTKELKE